MTGLTVRDAMTTEVVTVPARATIGTAIDRVLRTGHTHLVVVDEAGTLLDVISVHLLTVALMTRLLDRSQVLAGVLEVPATTRPETDLADAAEIMLDRSVDALGVVDASGSLVGILTWTDVGRAAVTGSAARAERRAVP